MTANSSVTGVPAGESRGVQVGPHYKWIALSNTTLGVLMATINQSIVLIALPDIFRGIGLNPLSPDNTSYLLWMFMGFLVVSAVLVVSFGRLGDMFGRVRMYNLGFAIFTVGSLFLTVTWMHGTAGALWLIGWRIVQGIGGAFLFANSTAILTDAFPANQRGTALGINSIAAIAGSFLGLLLGGLLGPINWHLVFLVSVPIGAFGTVWAYFMLKDIGEPPPGRGLTGGATSCSPSGWSPSWSASPTACCPTAGTPWAGPTRGCSPPSSAALAVLIVFGLVETKVAEPLFRLSLFRIRAFLWGNLANLMLALGRGGMQFMLIIWLQGIWLPLHGYSFNQTPLWAGIYLVPLTIGFLLSAPLSGILSDRFGAKGFTTGGALLTALTFFLLLFLPVNFTYWVFALIVAFNGFGSGLFASPNRAEMMNAVPANAARCGGRHDRHLHEHRLRAVDRGLLLADGGRAVQQAAGHAVQRPDRAGHPGGRGAPDLPPAADRRAVRGLPRLQPDEAAARPALLTNLPSAHAIYVDRASVLPAPDHRPVQRRPRGGLRVRDRGQRARRDRVGADRPGQAGPPAETLGAELAAVAADGGVLEPSELVVPDPADEAPGVTRANGQSTAITESGGKKSG